MSAPGLCLESGEFVPAADLPIDVAVPDVPSPFDVPTMNHVARRKLGELVAEGHQVCGVMIQRENADGTFQRGAVSAGGMVLWWPAVSMPAEPTEALLAAMAGVECFGCMPPGRQAFYRAQYSNLLTAARAGN